MSSTSLSENQHTLAGDGRFRSIACGVDGTRASFEAARQAAILARGGAALRLLAVTWETGTRAARIVDLNHRRAAAALERARAIVHDLGVRAEGALVDGPQAAVKLLEAARGADLIVVGSSGRSHAGGLVLGHAAAELLRDAPASVLVARHPPAGEFPAAILVAVRDPAASRGAAEAAGDLARLHGATVTLLAGGGRDRTAHHSLAQAAAAIAVITGVEPAIFDGHGKVHTAAAHAADEVGASLIVAAGRDAERVAERARCSVLVLRGTAPQVMGGDP